MSDQSPSQEPAFRVLAVVSRPLDQKELPTIADQWALVNGLATVKTPAYLHILRPPTIERLRNEILGGYDILHFDGHGSFAARCPNCMELNQAGITKCRNCSASLADEKPRGYLAFEQEDGRQDALAAEELAEMLRTVPGSPIKLVFLSACESGKGGDQSLAATLLQGEVPAVVGMKETVTVDATIALSRALYAALGPGRSIREAFLISLPELSRLPDSQKTGTKARDIPELLGRGVGERMVTKATRGSLIMEKERLLGVPDYDFVGEYIIGNPPRGRKGLLAQTTDALLHGEKLVVLTGQGGIGKSVLAAAAARRISWRYPGGIFWRSAVGKEEFSLDEFLDAFAEVFGNEFRTLPPNAKQDKVLGYLGDLQTPSLLVVDNAESVKDPALWSFLEGLPQPSAALVTTRDALKREGTHINVPRMEQLEAFRLFVAEARRRSPKWGEKLNGADTEVLQEIIRHLDGHPLGIKLASAHVAYVSLPTILEMLKAAPPFEVLTEFDFSYNTLLESQQELLQRIATFTGSFPEGPVWVISSGQLFENDNTKQIEHHREDFSELVRKNFVDVLGPGILNDLGDDIVGQRYRLHNMIRQYVSSKTGGAAIDIHRCRAAIIFLAFAARFAGNHNVLESERENLLAGMDWAYSAEEWTMVNGYAQTLDFYLDTRGYWNERRLRLTQAIEAARRLKDESSCSLFLGKMGHLEQLTGNLEEARYRYYDSLKIGKELKDMNGISDSLYGIGNIEQLIGNVEEARRLYNESLEIRRGLGNKIGVSRLLAQLGHLEQQAGNLFEARRLYKENLTVMQELDDKPGISKTMGQLGTLEQHAGNLEEARYLYKKSLDIMWELSDKIGISHVLGQLGTLEMQTGNLIDSRRLYRESLDIMQELKDKIGISNALYNMGSLEEKAGNLSAACSLYYECLKIAQEVKNKKVIALSLHKVGIFEWRAGNTAKARDLYNQSLEVKQEIGDNDGIAHTKANLALLEWREGNTKLALNLIQEAESLFTALKSPFAAKARMHREKLEACMK